MSIEQRRTSRLIRTFGFYRKELVSVMRQPRLILTLILGPFLILLVFGLGYRNTPQPYRTLVVVGEDSDLVGYTGNLSEAFGEAIDFRGVAEDPERARSALREGDVDLLIIAPTDALDSLAGNERAEFVVVHREVDPLVRASIGVLAQLSVDRLNRQVLTELASEAQDDMTGADVGDDERAGELLDRAGEVDPELLVSPFEARVEQIAALRPEPAVFYAPGTVILLIQHLAVTFAALSLVRERELGFDEVFRASPLTASQALAGKYLAFLTIAGVVGAALTGTMTLLGAPLPDAVGGYLITMVLVTFASLALGFLLSSLSRTNSQAVQYAMTVLLVSIFFTGFIIPLDRLIAPVQSLSYLIPGTYGIATLHDVMFRGVPTDARLLGGLGLLAGVLAMASWWAMRRELTVGR